MPTIQTNIVFEYLQECEENNTRIVLLEGSARAGKTVQTLIYFVQRLLKESGKTLSIVRKTLPSLKNSVLKDLIFVLEKFEIYEPNSVRKQEGYYTLPNGSIINWFSSDDPQKLRGSKRDYLFCNEANELTLEDFTQLSIRTEGMMVLDYNPSEIHSWVYELENREDCKLYRTTWRDNPFIEQSIIDEIERLKETDENYYRIYSLGLRGIPTTLVFTRYNTIDRIPDESKLLGYGMDFGYNDPTTLIAVYKLDNSLYIDEKLYVRNLTMPDIIYKMKELEIGRGDDIYCDSSNPQNIQELRRNGFNSKPVKKQSILSGIDKIKRHKIYITDTSTNTIEEFQSYKFKEDKNGNLLDVPIDDYNHSIDSIRYVLESTINKTKGNYRII